MKYITAGLVLFIIVLPLTAQEVVSGTSKAGTLGMEGFSDSVACHDSNKQLFSRVSYTISLEEKSGDGYLEVDEPAILYFQLKNQDTQRAVPIQLELFIYRNDSDLPEYCFLFSELLKPDQSIASAKHILWNDNVLTDRFVAVIRNKAMTDSILAYLSLPVLFSGTAPITDKPLLFQEDK